MKSDKTNRYTNLIERGLNLLKKAQSILIEYKKEESLSVRSKHGYRLGDNYYFQNNHGLHIIIAEYQFWKENVLEFINSEFEDDIETLFFAEDGGISDRNRLEDGSNNLKIHFIENLITVIKDRNDRLRELYNKNIVPGKDTSKNIFYINQDTMEIIKKDNDKFQYKFSKRNGVNNRFTYLIEIIKNNNISAKKLIDFTKTNNVQNLSKEIAEINKIFKGKLGIMDDIINNQKNTGYRINKKYSFEYTK